MKFTLEITCDNAAFTDAPCEEVARILRELAEKLERNTHPGKLRDVSGNTVGQYAFEN